MAAAYDTKKMKNAAIGVLNNLTKALANPSAKSATPLKQGGGGASSSSGSSGGSASTQGTPAATYKAPAYNDALYRQGIDTSYYDRAINNYSALAEKQRATQLREAQTTQNNALKQAYLTRAQNQLALNDNLARAGIRGGATETANLRLQNQYGTAVNSANTDYSNAVNSINQAIDKNIADYRSDMESRAEEYRQNLAQARWQADREDSLNAYNAKNEYWNNYYLDKYSGSSKESLQKLLKKTEAERKKAKTQSEKIRLDQKIRGITNRLGVIANSKK